MDQLTNKDKEILLEEFSINDAVFYNFKKSNQNKLLELFLILHEYALLSNELSDTGWDTKNIRLGLKLLRKCKRKISDHKKTKSEILNDLNHLEEYVISEIEELSDLYSEVIANQSSQNVTISSSKKEDGFVDVIDNLFTEFFDGIKWGLIILFIVIILFLVLAPTHIYPMIGNCYSREKLADCYFRIQLEKKQINEFTECQDSCGRGYGNEICLEECEYKYGMNKWSS